MSRSAGVRRLLKEASELAADCDNSYSAAPLEDDLFSWHFTLRGPAGDFSQGIYHGRLILPPNYPFAPPEVTLLTPSGRFETNKKICLSISSFHPESWQPSWGIRTALVALMAFFASEPKGAVGSLDAPPEERRRLAIASHGFKCSACGFDASIPLEKKEVEEEKLQSEVSPIEESVVETIVAPIVEENKVSLREGEEVDRLLGEVEDRHQLTHDNPPTTVFPTNRNVVNLPDGIGQGAETVVVAEAGRGVIVQGRAGGNEVVRRVETMVIQGGSPLYVDRAILLVLLALLALLVQKV